MKRSISSGKTFLFKVILPLVWFLSVGLGAVVLFFKSSVSFIPALLLWATGTVFLYLYGVRLKKVSVDETTLYISNYLKESMIPLKDIADVTEKRWITNHPVTIHLKTPTPFGDRVTFMPQAGFFEVFRSHPIVGELKNLAASKL